MTISIIPNLENDYAISQHYQNQNSEYCTLLWRRGQLLVKSVNKLKQPYLPVLDDERKLIACLKHSPINLVNIDPKIGTYWLKFWANACEQAKKPMFIAIPASHKLREPGPQILRILSRLIDWTLALILFLLLSPLMLTLMLMIRIYSPQFVFSYEWRVGERGKLFKLVKFCTESKQNINPLGTWISQSGLDKLPQLWNVLRGEMRLLSSHFWRLEEVVQLSLVTKENTLPISSKQWDTKTESQLLHIE